MKPNSCACYGSNDIHECYCNLNQNNMKQTAVEWLMEHLTEIKKDCRLSEISLLFNQAKEIEKKQIIDAYSNNGWNDEDQRANAELYYNEQFKKK